MEEDTPILTSSAVPRERLSVDELKARIEALKAEIAACEAELERKSAHRSAADALFGGSD